MLWNHYRGEKNHYPSRHSQQTDLSMRKQNHFFSSSFLFFLSRVSTIIFFWNVITKCFLRKPSAWERVWQGCDESDWAHTKTLRKRREMKLISCPNSSCEALGGAAAGRGGQINNNDDDNPRHGNALRRLQWPGLIFALLDAPRFSRTTAAQKLRKIGFKCVIQPHKCRIS